MYEKLTFTNSSIFTGSDANQVDDNIAQIRTKEISSGPPSSAGLAAGVVWTKSTGNDYTFNIQQDSLQWVPFGSLSKTNSIMFFHGQEMCNDSNGGPYVSSSYLDISSITAQNTWHTVGPTASGSYELTWSALDDIPRLTDWIRIRTIGTMTQSGSTVDSRVNLHARKWSGTTSAHFHNQIFRHGFTDMPTNSAQLGATNTNRLQVNSDNGFEIYLESETSQPSSFHALRSYIIGYGVHR